MSMFCFQCQEASKGTGCTLSGVCGKTPEVANTQDLLLFVVRGVALYNQELRKIGKPSSEADKFVFDGLFMTITNANFDKTRFDVGIIKADKKLLRKKGSEF